MRPLSRSPPATHVAWWGRSSGRLDSFLIREIFRLFLLSYLANELLRVVRLCPLVSVAVSGDRYSVGYSVVREPEHIAKIGRNLC